MKASPQKLAALRRKRRTEWYLRQYPIMGEPPSDVFLAAQFAVSVAEMKATIKRNAALLRRLKQRKRAAR